MNNSTTPRTDCPTADDFDTAWALAADADPAHLREWYEDLVDGGELPSALRPSALEECDLVVLRATVKVCELTDSGPVTPVCLEALDLDASDPGSLTALRQVAPNARREAWIEAMRGRCRHHYSRTACALRQPCEK